MYCMCVCGVYPAHTCVHCSHWACLSYRTSMVRSLWIHMLSWLQYPCTGYTTETTAISWTDHSEMYSSVDLQGNQGSICSSVTVVPGSVCRVFSISGLFTRYGQQPQYFVLIIIISNSINYRIQITSNNNYTWFLGEELETEIYLHLKCCVFQICL